MSLLRRAEKRSAPAPGVSFQDVFGRGHNIEDYRDNSSDSAMRMAAIFACVRIIADNVSTLPLIPKNEGDTLPELVTDGIRRGTIISWIQQLVTSLVLRGNAYGLIVRRDENGRPSEIVWLNPEQVALAGQDDTLTWATQPLLWSVNGSLTTDVLHLTNLHQPGRVLGVNAIEMARNTIAFGRSAAKWTSDLYTNGSVPSGVLTTDQPISAEDAAAIKQRFKSAVSGRDVAVMGLGAAYTPITMSPKDAEFVELQMLSATQIANIFGVAPDEVGGRTHESLTYSTSESKANRLRTFTLRPYLTKIEMALSQATGTDIVFDTNSLIRTELVNRYNAYQIAISAGFMSPNEARSEEGMKPREGGDEFATAGGSAPTSTDTSDLGSDDGDLDKSKPFAGENG